MVVSILIQVLLMKRIFYFQRDFLEVGESNNRASKDPIGISQPIASDTSNNKEQAYIFLKEHTAASLEESSVVKAEKPIESKTEEQQEKDTRKPSNHSVVDTEFDKHSTQTLVSMNENLEAEKKTSVKPGLYSQNIGSKKKQNQIQYRSIVLNQNSVEISKKDRANKIALEKDELFIESTGQEADNHNVAQQIAVTSGGEKTVVDDQILDNQPLDSTVISNSIENVNSLSISEFVKTDLEQQEIKAHFSSEISSEKINLDQKEEHSEDTIVSNMGSVVLNETTEISKDTVLQNLEVSSQHEDVLANSLHIKATSAFPNKDEVQELIGLEKVLQTSNVSDDIDSEVKPLKQEQQRAEKSGLEEKLHEQSFVIEDRVSKPEELISTISQADTQILVEAEKMSDKGEIVFFSGVNSDFSHTIKSDSLNDILVLEKGILHNLGIKPESTHKSSDITKNKMNKLKLFDNVVKKLTSNNQQEVDASLIQSHIENVESEVSFDGIRDTYQKIFNEYK